MITVTERAKQELKNLLIMNGADADEGLRLLPYPGGFALILDTELSGDQVVGYEGYKVLLVGIEYFQTLDGKTVDCQETIEGTVLCLC